MSSLDRLAADGQIGRCSDAQNLPPPPSAVCRPRPPSPALRSPLSALPVNRVAQPIRDRPPPRHGLESPCHAARAFKPVGFGRAVLSALRPPSAILHPPSELSVPSCQKSFRVFRGPILCPSSVRRTLPDRVRSYTRPAIRGRPDMAWKAHATWHGLSSPWVWDGPYAPSPVLRPPPAARSRAQLYATGAIRGRSDMGWKAHATWHGLSSPWVWDGPYALPSALRPIFASFAPLCGQPSVVPQPSVILCRAAARFSESTVHRQRHPNSTRTTKTDNGIAQANPRITTHPSPAPIIAKTPYTTVTSR